MCLLLPFPILNSVAKTCLFSNILENLLKARVYPLSFESFEKTTQILHKSANKFPNFYNRVWCQNLHRDGKCRDTEDQTAVCSVSKLNNHGSTFIWPACPLRQSTGSQLDFILLLLFKKKCNIFQVSFISDEVGAVESEFYFSYRNLILLRFFHGTNFW